MTDRVPIALAIETSNRGGGVALQLSDGRIEVEDLTSTRRHDDALMPGVDRLCGRVGVEPADLEVIGVSIGPGGFTGLRIAVITAKVLAHTTGAKLVAAPTASVVAAASEPGHEPGERMLVCLASKRGDGVDASDVVVGRALGRGGRGRGARRIGD
jgi:tRNA threonylcarbamoyladenosine biosynthesis protein TsaB